MEVFHSLSLCFFFTFIWFWKAYLITLFTRLRRVSLFTVARLSACLSSSILFAPFFFGCSFHIILIELYFVKHFGKNIFSFTFYVNCKMLDTKARGNPTDVARSAITATAARVDIAELATTAEIRRTKPPDVRAVV